MVPPERPVAISVELCPWFTVTDEASTVGVLRASFTIIDTGLDAEELTAMSALSVTVQVTEYDPDASLKAYLL